MRAHTLANKGEGGRAERRSASPRVLHLGFHNGLAHELAGIGRQLGVRIDFEPFPREGRDTLTQAERLNSPLLGSLLPDPCSCSIHHTLWSMLGLGHCCVLGLRAGTALRAARTGELMCADACQYNVDAAHSRLVWERHKHRWFAYDVVVTSGLPLSLSPPPRAAFPPSTFTLSVS